MTITIEKSGRGIGINALYLIFKDSKRVGSMTRFSSRDGWIIVSVPYALRLANGGKTIDEAKAVALTLDYPTPEEAYERACALIETERRNKMHQHHHADLVRLSRAIIAGSNSAHEELAALIAKIDAFVIDRSDTHPRDREDGENLNWDYRDLHHFGWYPKPPSRL